MVLCEIDRPLPNPLKPLGKPLGSLRSANWILGYALDPNNTSSFTQVSQLVPSREELYVTFTTWFFYTSSMRKPTLFILNYQQYQSPANYWYEHLTKSTGLVGCMPIATCMHFESLIAQQPWAGWQWKVEMFGTMQNRLKYVTHKTTWFSYSSENTTLSILSQREYAVTCRLHCSALSCSFFLHIQWFQ